MDSTKLRRALPFIVAMLFVVVALSRGGGERGVFLGLAVIFLIIGIRRRREARDRSTGG